MDYYKISHQQYIQCLSTIASSFNISEQSLHQMIEKHVYTQQNILHDVVNQATILNDIYHPGFRFKVYDSWKLLNLFKDTRIYYANLMNDSVVDLPVIKKLITEREPVNIAMRRGYDIEKFQETYGWSTGYYGRFFEKRKILAPNISLHSRVLFDNGTYSINVLHTIAYAFDTESQPDYQYIMSQDSKVRASHVSRLYTHIFNTINQCMDDFGYKYVFLPKMGAGVFSLLYEDDTGGSSGILKLYDSALLSSPLLNKKIFRLGIDNSDDMKGFPTSNNDLIQKLQKLFPNVKDDIQGTLDKILFINAWDPWSIPGNGNGGDKSLDGYVGRITSSAMCGWVHCNHHLLYDENYILV